MAFSMEHRVDNFRRLYARENERPLIGFSAISEYPLIRYPAAKDLPEDRALRPDDFDPVLYARDNLRMFELHEEHGGDFIFSAGPFQGIPWIEAFAGMDIFAHHASGTIFARRSKHWELEMGLEPFSEKNEWAALARSMIENDVKTAGGRYPLGTTRMRGISDVLFALRGDEFIFDLIDSPEESDAVCSAIADIIIGFGHMQLSCIPDFHGGLGSFFYNAWAPGGTVWLQEDAVALLSPKFYRYNIEKHLARIVAAFPHCVIHQHPVGFLPWDSYIDAGMLALELHIDEGGPSAFDLHETHSGILARKPLIVWGEFRLDQLEDMFGRLPPGGLAVSCIVGDRGQSSEIWKRFGSDE